MFLCRIKFVKVGHLIQMTLWIKTETDVLAYIFQRVIDFWQEHH